MVCIQQYHASPAIGAKNVGVGGEGGLQHNFYIYAY